jgi:hypothetical protein
VVGPGDKEEGDPLGGVVDAAGDGGDDAAGAVADQVAAVESTVDLGFFLVGEGPGGGLRHMRVLVHFLAYLQAGVNSA